MEQDTSHGFVGVHIGAGQHSEARTALYLEICAAACQAGTDVLKSGGTAVEAAAKATVVLEDAGETNAGFGSNLTESGTVEMDAGLMDGTSLLFGAVGAVSKVKNPILVAQKLVAEQKKGLLPLGRVPPGFLVGEGARQWAQRHGCHMVDTESLVSEKAAKLYRHYKKMLETYKLKLASAKRKRQAGSAENGLDKDCDFNQCKSTKLEYDTAASETVVRSHDGASKPLDGTTGDHEAEPEPASASSSGLQTKQNSADDAALSRPPSGGEGGKHLACAIASSSRSPRPGEEEGGPELPECEDKVQDTVGVVVLDKSGAVAASVSSGGIALKQPGRVGQASCFGCGCWAQKQQTKDSYSVAVSTTGCGEHLVRTFLARECAVELGQSQNPLQSLQKVMKEKFAESVFLAGVQEKLGGAICMQYDKSSGRGEFLWTHTTSSMGIGFQSTSEEEPTVKMSRLPDSAQQGKSILVETIPFSTSGDTN